ncbi:MAG: hypothetical protein KAJ07_12275 [Planctomycetes bacterium]|nr:hypothetical protein [Planctomycetota bacterium]
MDKMFLIMGFIMFAGLFFFLFKAGIDQHKLRKYLKDNYIEKWTYLTTFLFFGPGGTNGIRCLKFLFSNDLNSDKTLLKLKVSVKTSFMCFIIGMPATAIVFFLHFLFAGVLCRRN